MPGLGIDRLPEQLDSDLVMRKATAADAAPLGEFLTEVMGFVRTPDDLRRWTPDLLSPTHPQAKSMLILIVEHIATRQIVSHISMITQTWQYGSVPFRAAELEMVATHPDWRNRGLIRTQIELIHEYCDANDIAVVGTIGIPNYYRQFGHVYALSHQRGRIPDIQLLEKCRELQPRFQLRASVVEDLALISELGRQATDRLLFSCLRDLEDWHYELHGKHPESAVVYEFLTITDEAGTPVGVIASTVTKIQPYNDVVMLELSPEISWIDCLPDVLVELARIHPDNPPVLLLGEQHPSYSVLPRVMERESRGTSWYFRIADLAGFLHHVRCELTRTLRAHPNGNISGNLNLSCYSSGLQIEIEHGEVIRVDPMKPSAIRPDASFDRDDLMRLITGNRSFSELEADSPSNWTNNDRTRAILEMLFPKRDSHIWAAQ